MKNIILLGATGGTGRYLVEDLLSHLDLNAYHIVAAGTRADGGFASDAVEYVRVDISDSSSFRALPEQAYCVVDLAGIMPARMEGYHPQKYIDVNISGTLNVLEYCRRAGADRILYAQSFGDIKDWGEEKLVLTPDMPRRFRFDTDHTVYVLSKNFAVDLLENYRAMYGLKAFVFRLPTIYLWSADDSYFVDGQLRKKGYRILIDRAIHGEPLEIWGDPKRKKDMVYVKDFCQMLRRAVLTDTVCHGHYNVGTGIGTTLEAQVRGIAEVFGSIGNIYPPILYCPDRPNAPQYIMDITSAVNDLGYQPEYSYLQMLQDMKKIYQTECAAIAARQERFL